MPQTLGRIAIATALSAGAAIACAYCGYFGRHRSMSLRSASMPAASIFAQCAGFSRMARSTRRSSSGFGGLPPLFFGSSMSTV